MITKNFDKCYYVPMDKNEDLNYNLEPMAVRRRGIYKDTYKCTKVRNDYQLRPNGCVGYSIAPELFVHEHAGLYLAWVEEMLIVDYLFIFF